MRNLSFLAALTIASVAIAQDPAGQPVSPPTTQPAQPAAGQPAVGVPATAQPVTVQPLPSLPDARLPMSPAITNPLAPVRLNRSGQTVLSPRIRNITRLANSMPHYLTGVGLVTGLANTGSSDRGTRQAILNYIKQHDLNLTIADVVGGTTALVSVTCSLPPFAKAGMPLDVKVEVLSDASSLRGGGLVRAELKGVDGQTYVVAQGALIVAGYTAGGANASVQKNTNTTAWLHNGGLVVREEGTSFYSESGALELQVLNPSAFNAASIAAGVKTALAGSQARVSAVDTTLVRIELPDADRTNHNAIRILQLVGNVRVAVENPAKVLVDQASGTVLAGEGVLISPCVVGISDLTIAIVEEDFISQPNPLSDGQTQRVGRTRVEAQTTSTDLQAVGGGATVADLLQNLKTLGMTPSQLVSVFQALDHGGFLHATLEVR